MSTTQNDRAYIALNYLASAILIGIVLVLALHKSGSQDSDLVFGRWSPPFFKVLIALLVITLAHFLVFKFTRIGRKIFFPGVVLAGLSVLFTLTIVEFGLRMTEITVPGKGLDSHPVLVRKFDSGAPGHDSWGWRNKTVPESADFVFVGDSQTYGNVVARDDAFPQVFGRISGASTYNLALGGYGPLEYSWIFKEYGQRLSPDLVVVELFLGNDIPDVIELKDHISDFGIDERAFDDVDYEDSAKKLFDSYNHLNSLIGRSFFVEGSWFLRQRSELFKLLDGGYKFSREGFQHYESLDSRMNEIRELLTPEEQSLVDLQLFFPYEDENIKTIFTPVRRLIPVSSDKSDIQRAIPIIDQIFAKLNDNVSAQGGRLVVLLIPTKEVVYYPYLREREVALPPSYELLIDLVTEVKGRFTESWHEAGICVIDLTSDLQASAMKGTQLFPKDIDGHYNKVGNIVIANSLLRQFQGNGEPETFCPVWPQNGVQIAPESSDQALAGSKARK